MTLAGSVPLIPELADFNRRFDTTVNTVFNMTEISSPIEADYDETTDMPVTACGRTRPGDDLRVVDEHDRELPRGQLGELIVRADEPWVLNAGYFNMPEKTAEAWRNGWFHTGDGFIQDAQGWFHFVDRQKDAIRRRGENISSMEVEAHVLLTLPCLNRLPFRKVALREAGITPSTWDASAKKSRP